jgi:ABC-type phosphate transport system substrate-binding protein
MKFVAKLLLISASCVSIAYADVVVVVSSKSSVSELSKDQVADLYLGKSQELGGGAAALFDLPNGALKDTFYDKATGRSLAQVKATWSKLLFNGKGLPPKEVASPADLKKAISANPNAIGYMDGGAVDSSVKVVLKLN